MSNDKKKRNKGRDAIGDYYKTNTQYARENRDRQKDDEKPRGLKNLNPTEKIYVAVIALGLIAIIVKYVILG